MSSLRPRILTAVSIEKVPFSTTAYAASNRETSLGFEKWEKRPVKKTDTRANAARTAMPALRSDPRDAGGGMERL